MEDKSILRLLREFKEGKIDEERMISEIKAFNYEDIGFAKIDHHRSLRKGFPEVIYCEGKSPAQVLQIIEKMLERGLNILGTRADKHLFEKVKALAPEAEYNELARTIAIEVEKAEEKRPGISVVSAGTADLPVAEEAVETAAIMGNIADRIYDVGVAGIHRLLSQAGRLQAANVVVVVAGMEGALASVVGGLVDAPVIAVPTSIGYGANFHGVAPLLTMLNSCSSGVGVVNIDNGFGAGYLAALINRRCSTPSS